MDIKWLTLLMVWSISTTSVILIEISSADPSGMSVEASHYLTADTNLKHVVPSEELRRTQRSFFKKLWKNTGLQNVFCDRGCVPCCNNNGNNVDEGDTYESPVNPAYNTYIQQLAPLPRLPLIHPLWMFEPFLRPTCSNSNGPKRGGFVSNFDESNTPSKWEAGNSNALQNGYEDDYINSNSKIVDDCSYKNLNENKAKEYGNHDQEKIYSNSDTSGISGIKNTSNIKNVYINVKPPHEEPYQNIKTGSGEVSQYKELKTTSSGIYPTSQDADKQSNLVYQPIIYVSPQYQHSCEGGSVYGYPNPSSKDIAVYTIVKQIPNAFTSALQHQPAPPITLTELDQPYRDCPELFTNYLNQISNNQNWARANTFVNGQYISC